MTSLRQTYTVVQFAKNYGRETDQVEFKTGVSSQKIADTVVAFSNTSGGTVFVGVADGGDVTGRRLDQGTAEQLHQAVAAVHDPGRYFIREITVGGHPVIAVSVARREEGFAQTSEGRTLVRRGPSNRALFGQELQDFINLRALRKFEASKTELTVADVDSDLLDELVSAIGLSRRSAHFEDRLRERSLMGDATLTVAGALFLTYPADSMALLKAVVEVRRFRDDGPDYDRREVFGGPLHHQVRDASQFVSEELGSELIVTGLYRYEMPRLPEVVVREAIANAVAHRSYEADRTVVLVEIRPAAVIVRSPGGLPEPVTIETIRSAQAARNPVIIDVLRKFSLAEDAGRGVDVMEDAMQEALLDPPSFEEDGAFVTVRLPLSGPITGQERAWIADLERRGTLETPDRILVVHAARGEVLTNRAARDILNTEDSGVARRSLQRLRDSGILLQDGDRGSSTYRLAERIAPPAAFRMTRGQLEEAVLDRASEHPLTNEFVRDLTGLDRVEALKLLQGLVRSGRLRQTGVKRGTRYIAR